MRFLACCLALLFLAMPVRAQTPDPASPRVRLSLNQGWRFLAGDVAGAQAPTFEDAGWAAVDLPHTWNAGDALQKEQPYRRGAGWYRRRLELAAELQGKRMFLYFEGANQVAEVWVNGREAGRHVGGYTAFALDVTGLVAFDRPNVLAVRVDNWPGPDIPPLAADFTFYGGIYRNVWLLATDPLHLTVLDHASPGVFVDAPGLTAARAEVRLRGTVVNDGPARRGARVVSRILDPEGREVATTAANVALGAGASAGFERLFPAIASPRLWSPERPELYTVRTEVWDGGRLADRVDTPLGLRWYAWAAHEGFSLNGRPYPLRGTNRHQDFPGLGNALPDSLQRRDIRLVKETGFNFLRLAHYPQAPAVLDEADRAGLALWEEVPVVNRITRSEAFAANAERMLAEMIRQHYNHPAVFFWGYMNEVMLQPPRPMPAGYVDAVTALARRLNQRAHAQDPTRPTVMAVFGQDTASALHDVPDILGLNLYFGWYYGQPRELGSYLDSLHARYPHRPLMISEYGAGGDGRIHAPAAYTPRPFDFSTEYEQRYHEATFPQVLARPWLLGSAVWNQFDFGSWGRDDARPDLNDKGLFYFDRRPKDVAWYYQARLRSDPVLHIATGDWPRRAGSTAADRQQEITVYSNAREVELRLGGASLGRRPVQDGAARWTVRLAPGENRLEARASFDEREVADSTVVHYQDRTALFRGAAGAGGVGGAASVGDVAAAGIMAVNAGSATAYVDAAGVTWEPDREYSPGAWGRAGGAPALARHRIYGSDDDPLLRSTTEGAAAYRFDLADGRYQVELRFAETVHDRPGERVFDVRINGEAVAQHLDLAAAPGRWHAHTISARVDAVAGRGITIELPASAGASTVSAILLRRL